MTCPKSPSWIEIEVAWLQGPAFHDDVILPLKGRNKAEHMSDSWAVNLEDSFP